MGTKKGQKPCKQQRVIRENRRIQKAKKGNQNMGEHKAAKLFQNVRTPFAH